jgi:hypothetical protein
VRLQAWKALGVLLGLTEGMTKLGILKGLVGGRGGDDENEEHDAKRMGLEMPLKTASMYDGPSAQKIKTSFHF